MFALSRFLHVAAVHQNHQISVHVEGSWHHVKKVYLKCTQYNNDSFDAAYFPINEALNVVLTIMATVLSMYLNLPSISVPINTLHTIIIADLCTILEAYMQTTSNWSQT